MNTAVYGTSMKNLRNRIAVRLPNREKNYLKWISNPSYMTQKIFNNNLIAVLKSKVMLRFNKPAYVGMCILDFIKELMYEFHYDSIKNKYGSKARLLFTDTDS